jgi:hypothetical protein
MLLRCLGGKGERTKRERTLPREGNNKSYHLAFFRVRVFTIVVVVIYRAA